MTNSGVFISLILYKEFVFFVFLFFFAFRRINLKIAPIRCVAFFPCLRTNEKRRTLRTDCYKYSYLLGYKKKICVLMCAGVPRRLAFTSHRKIQHLQKRKHWNFREKFSCIVLFKQTQKQHYYKRAQHTNVRTCTETRTRESERQWGSGRKKKGKEGGKKERKRNRQQHDRESQKFDI